MTKDDITIQYQGFHSKNVSGEIDLEASRKLARDFAYIAELPPNHNILIDMRDTTLSVVKVTDLMQITLEIGKHLKDYSNKIANLVPDNPERLRIAREFRACMQIKNFAYEVFTDYEEAIEWLSETQQPRGLIPNNIKKAHWQLAASLP